MKAIFMILFIAILCIAAPAVAQDEQGHEGHEDMGMAPPPSLETNDFCKWMIGEWEGWAEGPEGKTKEWEQINLGLNGQFLYRHAKSDMGAFVYEGRGAMTVHPETGDFMGVWMDTFRGLYNGKGKQDGDKMTMTWEGYQGTYKQVVTKTGEDSYTYSYSFTDPTGNTAEGKGEMTRMKKMSDK